VVNKENKNIHNSTPVKENKRNQKKNRKVQLVVSPSKNEEKKTELPGAESNKRQHGHSVFNI
jgi:hypothetical protein